MFTLSNGCKIEFVVASGALGYDGRGWPWEWPFRWLGIIRPKEFTVITKTLTRYAHKGNLSWYRPWSVVRPIPGGLVNAVGLTNPGIEWWRKKCYSRILRGQKIIVSIFSRDVKECEQMCELLNPLDIVGIEINASCPNIEHPFDYSKDLIEICRTASAVSRHPLILKISCLHPAWLIQEASGYVEAVDAINSVPWALVFPAKKSPLAPYGGGAVSGPIIQPFVEDTLKRLIGEVDAPIIAGGGINSLEVIKHYALLGAQAFSIGILFPTRPWQPNRLVRQWSGK